MVKYWMMVITMIALYAGAIETVKAADCKNCKVQQTTKIRMHSVTKVQTDSAPPPPAEEAPPTPKEEAKPKEQPKQEAKPECNCQYSNIKYHRVCKHGKCKTYYRVIRVR